MSHVEMYMSQKSKYKQDSAINYLEYQTKFYINDRFMAQTVDEIIILRAEMCFPVLFGRQFHVLAAEFGKIKFAGKT